MEPFGKNCVVRVRCDFGNSIDILGGTNARGHGVGDEQTRGTSADEDEFIEHRPQSLDNGLQQRAIGISHVATVVGARPARARPTDAPGHAHHEGHR